MDGTRSVVAGTSLVIGFVAMALSLLIPLTTEPPRITSAPVAIDLSLLITGQGAIGGPARSHLYDPQLLVARRGDTVRLRVLNQSNFRHGIEIAGYDVRTGGLAGGGVEVLTLTASKSGIFEYRCYLPYDPSAGTCAPDHEAMVGHLVVIEPGAR